MRGYERADSPFCDKKDWEATVKGEPLPILGVQGHTGCRALHLQRCKA